MGMNKKITLWLAGLVVLVPIAVSAQVMSGNTQLISLYQQLIVLLQQELNVMQGTVPTTSTTGTVPKSTGLLSLAHSSGTAPLTVSYTLSNLNGTEALDYGDGHSSGSNGCVKNSQGNCDLTKGTTHTYVYPGTYTVTLYDHGTDLHVVSTQKVTVSPAAVSATH
jgi:hypothetical protein